MRDGDGESGGEGFFCVSAGFVGITKRVLSVVV